MKTVFRIHKMHPEAKINIDSFRHGMWYDNKGNHIDVLNSNNMPYEEKASELHSCITDATKIPLWFSRDQLIALKDLGYELYKYKVLDYTERTKGEILVSYKDIYEMLISDTVCIQTLIDGSE